MSKKSKSTVEPSKFAKPYITQGANALNDAYGANSGQIQNATNSVVGLLPDMINKYQEGDAGVNAARGYNVDVLAGKYLNSNPWFDQVVNASNDDIRNQSQAALSLKGLTGGSDYANIISKNVGRNTAGMRSANYDNERSRMATAAGQAPGLASADVFRIAPMLAMLEASQTPIQAAAGYAGGLGGLLGGYTNSTQKKSPWEYIAQAAGNAASAFAGGG